MREGSTLCGLALRPEFRLKDTLAQQLLAFGRHYEQIASPFESKFTRQDLDRLLAKLDHNQARLPPARLAA